MEDRADLREGVAAWLAFITPMLAPIEKYEWAGQDFDHFWEILKRGVIKRQQEALEAILKMADVGVGHFGVTLLRPAYEELIWIEYLDQNSLLAKELVVLLGFQEVANNLSAQNDFIGAKGMHALGFTQRFVKTYIAHNRKNKARLTEIGKRLGWRDGSLPSMAFLSRKVGREREYKFLYQGTSRYVHFSTQEIFRRVWGKKGDVIIGSSSFSGYWEDFSIYWSFRLLITLLAHCVDLLGDVDVSSEKSEEMMKWLTAITPIPIITKGELESWSRSSEQSQ